VKTDVASLYPSLMRLYRIGPSGDRLGALLHILDRLTDLRLHHKAAARAAPPGSIEANQHDGTQAAMKTLINAAYGYMGAGSMALFADLDAANEVIVRGVALRSSRAEPFGERFLRQALQRVMLGDVAGVKACYQETVEALRGRLLPAGDVAAQVRLSKTPQAYLAARAKHPEAQYEA